ncbi:MAG: hypothetical protein WCF57_03820 [Pyrinomonadaceae bacterium]
MAMMRIDVRLARVEQLAGRVIPCAWCRVYLVPAGRVVGCEAGRTADYDVLTCRWCGNRFLSPVGGLTPHQKESLRLWYNKYDGETYTDERVYAAERWWHYLFTKRALEKKAKAGKVQQPASRSYNQRPPKLTQKQQAREDLKEEARELVLKANAREQNLYEHRRTFPLVARLKELDQGEYDFCYSMDENHDWRSQEEKAALQFLNLARLMAECEIVLWGKVEPETQREIEELTKKATELETERRRLKQDKREKEERERQEQRERYQLEKAERERQKTVRHQPRIASSAFWRSGASLDDVSDEEALADVNRTINQFSPMQQVVDIAPETSDHDSSVVRIHEIPPKARRRESPTWKPDPWEPGKNDPMSTLPPDNGTLLYARKKAHYQRTGQWLPDECFSGA